ncbi:MAG: polysaccharide deacetylase family protein [Ectobacillus sp.]
MKKLFYAVVIYLLIAPTFAIAAPNPKITWDAFRYDATATTIYTENVPNDVTEVRYLIWRTADRKGSAKNFVSKKKQQGFSIRLDTKQFQSKRGQYEIEAIGVKRDGSSASLAKTALIFQQYVPILMYHSIAPFTGSGLEELYVSPENFEAQMRYLKTNGYTPLTFEHWGDINIVNKPVFITLDDGYKNNLNALEIFKNLKDETFQPTGTIFVAAGFIGREKRLSATELKDMAQSGFFSIQSHTMFHPDLTKATNDEYELKTSKETLAAITGKPVLAFAYPYGFYNDEVIGEVKKYYRFAVTVRPGVFIEKGLPDEYYKLPRQFVTYKTTLQQFAKLLQP